MKTAMRREASRQRGRKAPRMAHGGIRRVMVSPDDMERLRQVMKASKAERTEVEENVRRLIESALKAR